MVESRPIELLEQQCSLNKMPKNELEAASLAAMEIREAIEQHYKDLSPEHVLLFTKSIYAYLKRFRSMKQTYFWLLGLKIVDELVDIQFGDPIAKVSFCAHYIRHFMASSEILAELSSKVLGHLSVSCGTTMHKFVSHDLSVALEGLQRESNDLKRYSFVCNLCELAANSPIIFATRINDFLNIIWIGITDSKQTIARKAVRAFSNTLNIINNRDNDRRNRLFEVCYNSLMQGLSTTNSITSDVIRGYLMALGEFVLNVSLDFLSQYIYKIYEVVWAFRNSRKGVIHSEVVRLLGIITDVLPDQFGMHDYHQILAFLLTVAADSKYYKKVALESITKIAHAVGGRFSMHFSETIDIIEQIIERSLRGKLNIEDCIILRALAAITRSLRLKKEQKKEVVDTSTCTTRVLDLVFRLPLSEHVCSVLQEIVLVDPSLLLEVQFKLISISQITLYDLDTRELRAFEKQAFFEMKNAMGRLPFSLPPKPPANNKPEKLVSVFRALRSFSFASITLTVFVKDALVAFLEYDEPSVRLEAVKTICALLIPPNGLHLGHFQTTIVHDVLSHLLVTAVGDADCNIRRTVLQCLDIRYDKSLSQPEALRALSITLNDRDYDIRVASIELLGRLAFKNSASILPTLRNLLLHLLTEIVWEGNSDPSVPLLLRHLTQAAPELVRPYCPTIVTFLQKKFEINVAYPGPYLSSLLKLLSQVCLVGGPSIDESIITSLLSLLQNVLGYGSVQVKKCCIDAMSAIVRSTGFTTKPYHLWPNLLDSLLTEASTDYDDELTVKLFHLIGTIGAIDPNLIKVMQASTDKTKKKPENTQTLSANDKHYTADLVIRLLLDIFNNNNETALRKAIANSITHIFEQSDQYVVQLLPAVMRTFIRAIRMVDESLQEALFKSFANLVSVVKEQIQIHVDSLFYLINECWRSGLQLQIVRLIEELSRALSDEFRQYMPMIMPLLLDTLKPNINFNCLIADKVLDTLVILGEKLDDWLFLVIPTMMQLISADDVNDQTVIKTFQTLGKLASIVDLTMYSSMLVHMICETLNSAPRFLHSTVMDTLCRLVQHFGSTYVLFVPTVQKCLERNHISHTRYLDLVRSVCRNPSKVSTSKKTILGPNPLRKEIIQESSPATRQIASFDFTDSIMGTLNVSHENATREEWLNWFQDFSTKLLEHNPIPVLRCLKTVAQHHTPLLYDVFNVAFAEVYHSSPDAQKELTESVELAISSKTIPNDLLLKLLNLCEFLEHRSISLNISPSVLADLAAKCDAYAKSLYYCEQVFESSPARTVENIISLNNTLHEHQGALGVMIHCHSNKLIRHIKTIKASWYEQLNYYEKAYDLYGKEVESETNPEKQIPLCLGRIRCLYKLGDWERVITAYHAFQETLVKLKHTNSTINLRDAEHVSVSSKDQVDASNLAASAAWNLQDWGTMRNVVESDMSSLSVTGTFFRSILAFKRQDFKLCREWINKCREQTSVKIRPLIIESYDRAYNLLLIMQQLAELEEQIEYSQLASNRDFEKERFKQMWNKRMEGCSMTEEVWRQLLLLRSTVIPKNEDIDLYLQYVQLCNRFNVEKQASRILEILIGEHNHHVDYVYLKHMYRCGKRAAAFDMMTNFVENIQNGTFEHEFRPVNNKLKSKIFMKLGQWHVKSDPSIDQSLIFAPDSPELLSLYSYATMVDPNSYKPWHLYATRLWDILKKMENESTMDDVDLVRVAKTALEAFCRAVEIGGDTDLQDKLRLLDVWIKYNHSIEKATSLVSGLPINVWLAVIPQIIARLNTHGAIISSLLGQLVDHHAQALVWSLQVAADDSNPGIREFAKRLFDKLGNRHGMLLSDAALVRNELIRVAVLLSEKWHSAIDKAIKLYHGESKDTQGVLDLLIPLHAELNGEMQTRSEKSFKAMFGVRLQQAYDCLQKTKTNSASSSAHISEAFQNYSSIVRELKASLATDHIDLCHTSPDLKKASDLSLHLPGFYSKKDDTPRIRCFRERLSIYPTKQRPRQVTIVGTDGRDYIYLLKGHEDLRQDERFMQILDYIDSICKSDMRFSGKSVAIQTFRAIPLNTKTGLLSWVDGCDTLHSLIRDYRVRYGVVYDCEVRRMRQYTDNYQHLSVLQKLFVFEAGINSNPGNDLARMIWLRARSCELWLNHRSFFTRSLATMSMVGYIIGLGDRHLANIMINRNAGNIIHIDFGDCFEVAMIRDRYPEKVPFRLTRTLIKAMGISGIEGIFRQTAQNVMELVRHNRETIQALLEAFIYDPILSFRLIAPQPFNPDTYEEQFDEDLDDTIVPVRQDSDATALLNEKALNAIERVRQKLYGVEFDDSNQKTISVEEQVERLILSASSSENLAQAYFGWCPFW
ncbi:hypothetical protein PCE1_000241 [Barthelona sp. PCE]